jgi:Protein of unknown function (DUF2840)
MRARAISAMPADRHATGFSTRALTEVELVWIEKRMEHRLRFGKQVSEHSIDKQRRVVSFAPGRVFALVRWQSNAFRTVFSSMDIVRAIGPGEAYKTLPFVRPGGDILLHVEGSTNVERVLRMIDAIDLAQIDPTDVSPDYWQEVHKRLAGRLEPHRYTYTRHNAWLARREANR